MMGNKVVRVDQYDDLHVDGQLYYGTRGLWALITGVTKDQIGIVDQNYTYQDLLEYVKVMQQTNVLHRNFDPENPYRRENSSWKWKHFLKDLWESIKEQHDKRDDLRDNNDNDRPGAPW